MAQETGGVMADVQTERYEKEIDQLDLQKKFEPDRGRDVTGGVGRTTKESKEVNVNVEISNPMFIDSSRDREKFIRFFEEELGEVVRDYV